eukprot:CAMPEP_0172474358 /NCGR_PEP_ID=MMETSP1065-20121228/69319_1 /TAXON_ID=265537 /ORGANISM="Amphiprora paludosa, Strain CCMP125" /LENGTH=321 /DNA_ID=CAMNT_0013232539 /DNA_START=46 /DNA_END=1011 /DNA_ORIENTATION=+
MRQGIAAAALLLLTGSAVHKVTALPVQFVINHGAEECLYDQVKKGESFTLSAFILGGDTLKAHIHCEGPVAPPDVDSAAALTEAEDKYDKKQGDYGEKIEYVLDTDFESLNIADDDDVEDDADSKPKEGETAEEMRARRAQERRKALEAKQREERVKQQQKKFIRDEGEPLQKTFEAKADGWYRVCAEARHSTITMEIDFRKESEYGGKGDHGHVFTMEEKAVEEEEKDMEGDTAAKEGISDEDFQVARDKLKTLRRLLADIQSKQTNERHRLMIHSATNEHSHSRMVLASLLETVLFMLVTGFQVFTIRRWFKGAPVLGR